MHQPQPLNEAAIIEINDEDQPTKSIKKSASPPHNRSEDRITRTRDQSSKNSYQLERDARSTRSRKNISEKFILIEDDMPPPSKKLKATSEKSTSQEVEDCGETSKISTVKGQKIYGRNGSKLFCLLDKKGLGNTDSGVCDFITKRPKQMAEHISYHHREDSLIFRKLIKNQFEGVPAVGGLKFSMAQKKIAKSASWGNCQLGTKI